MSRRDEDDHVFRALSAPTRRAILDLLRDRPRTTGELCEVVASLDRCTVMQHLNVLEEAGLVIAHRKGRERWNHLNSLPIKQIHDRWIGPYARHAVGVIDRLARDLDPSRADVPRAPTHSAIPEL